MQMVAHKIRNFIELKPNIRTFTRLQCSIDNIIFFLFLPTSMNCVFWATTNIPSIKTAGLNGSNITTLVNFRMGYPGMQVASYSQMVRG